MVWAGGRGGRVRHAVQLANALVACKGLVPRRWGLQLICCQLARSTCLKVVITVTGCSHTGALPQFNQSQKSLEIGVQPLNLTTEPAERGQSHHHKHPSQRTPRQFTMLHARLQALPSKTPRNCESVLRLNRHQVQAVPCSSWSAAGVRSSSTHVNRLCLQVTYMGEA